MELQAITDPSGDRWEIRETGARLRSDPGWLFSRIQFRNVRTGEQREIGSMAELRELSDAALRRLLRTAGRRRTPSGPNLDVSA